MHGEMQTSPGWRAKVEFHLTDGRADPSRTPRLEPGMIPALLAGYRDLTTLRYDFPVILVAGGREQRALVSLSEVINDALGRFIGDKAEGRLRHHAFRIEKEIRAHLVAGGSYKFSQAWKIAVDACAADGESEFVDSARRLRSAITDDGEIVDCNASAPARILRHAFAVAQKRKAGRLLARLNRLTRRLSDMLKADEFETGEGRKPEKLKASVGRSYAEAFDFEALSRLIDRARPPAPLPESRRHRIEKLLAVLNDKTFRANSGDLDGGVSQDFVFESPSDAVESYRQRLPRAAEFVRSMAIAELEIDGRYDPTRHDPIFEGYGQAGATSEEFVDLPDYLVLTNARKLTPRDMTSVVAAYSAGLPLKILLQTDDIVSPAVAGNRHQLMPRFAHALVEAALGFGNVFVLQTGLSHLLRHRTSLIAALTSPEPAFISVFSGASSHSSGLPPYLVSAAATESRAFPSLSYDPANGKDWASRFSLAENPQPEADWPKHAISFENAAHERLEDKVRFTLADFLVCDDRFVGDFVPVPKEDWSDGLVPLANYLADPPRDAEEALPTVLLVDRKNTLRKAVVDAAVLRETRRCLERWRVLQERGGINNSYVAAARRTWEMEVGTSRTETPVAKATPTENTPPAPVAAEPEAERSPDEPYIETLRCSSCNECTQINGKMFAYDKNKQAYIADPDAGTYRQLVEAAESCQVSVIHPGKPRNPKESGVEELIERAKAFA